MLLALGAAHGSDALIGALSRAVAFRRFRAADVRSILAAGTGIPIPVPAGGALVIDLPVAPAPSLADYTMDTLARPDQPGTTSTGQTPTSATEVKR